jgi:prolyl-tRNA synthetase
MTEAVEKLVKKSEDPSRWYLQLVRRAKLADYGPVRGTFAIRPYGFEIWERVQRDLDDRFKAFPCSSPRATSKRRPPTSRASTLSWRG